MNDPDNKRDTTVVDIGGGVLEAGGEIAAEGILDTVGDAAGVVIGGIADVAGEVVGGALDGLG